MNTNAKAWVAALKSDKYKQGKGQLRQGDTFCCLGVACDLYEKAGKAITKSTVAETGVVKYNEHWAVLPKVVKAWLGLKDTGGTISSTVNLASMNDKGKSFKEIATAIKKHEKVLFKNEL
jgi:hypothetical protein